MRARRGVDIPWWVWALGFIVVIGVLGYLRVDFSAKMLGILLTLEVGIVLVWNMFVVGTNAAAGTLTFAPFDPSLLANGSLAVGLVFAITCFSGFEATAVYRDEVKDPQRTVPRATFIAIGVITVLFVLASWGLVAAFGADDALAAIASDPTGAFFATVTTYLGRVGFDIVTLLLITSTFAALVAYHNVVSRYLFSLGADGVLPRAIGTSHAAHGSPHRASVLLTVASLVFVALIVLTGQDAVTTYATLVGVAGYTFIVLLVLASVGIAVYLVRSPHDDLGVWTRVIAPVLSAAIFIVIGVMCTLMIDLMTGSAGTAVIAASVAAVAVGAGVALALFYRFTRPGVYTRIGRQ